MTAEIGMKVNKVTFERSEDMLKPYSGYYNGVRIDMSIDTDDGVFHLCGRNDWGLSDGRCHHAIVKICGSGRNCD